MKTKKFIYIFVVHVQVDILFIRNENKILILLSPGIFAGRKPGGHVREVGAETRVSSRGRIVKPVQRNERTQITNTTQQQNDARTARRRSRVAKRAGNNRVKAAKNVSGETTGSGNQRKQYPLRRSGSTGNKVRQRSGSRNNKKEKNTPSDAADSGEVENKSEGNDIVDDDVVAEEVSNAKEKLTVADKSENLAELASRNCSVTSAQSATTVCVEINECRKRDSDSEEVTEQFPIEDHEVIHVIKTQKDAADNNFSAPIKVETTKEERHFIHAIGGHRIESDDSTVKEGNSLPKIEAVGADASGEWNRVPDVINRPLDVKRQIKKESTETTDTGVAAIQHEIETKRELTSDKMDSIVKDEVDNGSKDKSGPDLNEMDVKKEEDESSNGPSPTGGSRGCSPTGSSGHVTGSPGEENKAEVPAITGDSRKSPMTFSPADSHAANSGGVNIDSKNSGSPSANLNSQTSLAHTGTIVNANVGKSLPSATMDNEDSGDYMEYNCPKKKFLKAMKSHSTTPPAGGGPGKGASVTAGGGTETSASGNHGNQSTAGRAAVGETGAKQLVATTTPAATITTTTTTTNNNVPPKAPFNLRSCIDRIMESPEIRECLRNTSDTDGREPALKVLNNRAMDPPPQQKILNAISAGEMRSRSGSATLHPEMRPRGLEGFVGRDEDGRPRAGSGTLPADMRPRAGTLPGGILARVKVTQAGTPAMAGAATEMRMSPIEMRQRAATASYPSGHPPRSVEQPSPQYRQGEYDHYFLEHIILTRSRLIMTKNVVLVGDIYYLKASLSKLRA